MSQKTCSDVIPQVYLHRNGSFVRRAKVNIRLTFVFIDFVREQIVIITEKRCCGNFFIKIAAAFYCSGLCEVIENQQNKGPAHLVESPLSK